MRIGIIMMWIIGLFLCYGAYYVIRGIADCYKSDNEYQKWVEERRARRNEH